MHRTPAVLVAVFALCVAAFVSPAASSASVRTWPDGRACSSSSCTVVHGAGQSDYVTRGHRVSVSYLVYISGPAATAVLDVVGSTHLHLKGTATIDSAAAAKGSVTKRGTHVQVALPSNPDSDERSYQVDVPATVDNTAYTDMTTSASVEITAPGAATGTARTSMTVTLDRPAVYVWSHPTFTVRAGHHRQMDAIFSNQATVTTRTATLSIALPPYTRLSNKWGVMFDNRRMHCTGSRRSYRCAVTKMPKDLSGSLMIDIRATKHAPHRYVGRIFLTGSPTGYTNGGTQNHSSTRITIKR